MKKKKISEVVTQTEERESDSMKEKTGEEINEKKTEENTGRDRKDATEEPIRKTGNGSWIYWGILVSAALALVMFCMYGFFRDRAKEHTSSPMEEYGNIEWLYKNCYMLYRDLYNAQTGEQKNYKELYVQPQEGYEWILEADAWDESRDKFTERYESVDSESDGDQYDYYILKDGICGMENLFRELEDNYSALNNGFDYVIRDNQSGFYLTNMSEEDLNRSLDDQYFQVGFTFNEHGSVMVADDVAGCNTVQIRKFANEAAWSIDLRDFLGTNEKEIFSRYGTLCGPVNCTVIFRISKEDWTSIQTERQFAVRAYRNGIISYGTYIEYAYPESTYRDANMEEFLYLLLVAAVACGFLLPVPDGQKVWRKVKICRLPLESLLVVGIVVFAGFGELIFKLAVYTASGSMEKLLIDYLIFEVEFVVRALINIVCLTVFFFCGWYLGICARAVRDLGIKEYIKQRCILYRIFPFIKSKAVGFYEEVCHLDVTRNANKMILKIVLVNAVILLVISCFWVTGFPFTVAYSIFLYFILRNYISKLQKKYGQLLHATNEIAEGNLNVKITEDLGVFEPFKPQIIRIQNGFKNAVEEETKSQRMKAELITNVSHDLKTPLTAIITYINLLKDENITEEQRKEYLDTLERKSLRLKVLIEDLFEVSKANSQTITLNIMDVDIMNLVKQVVFEMSDKMAASELDVRMNLTDEKVILPLDSQKTYRVYENLLGNIAKYALPGTRVYINGFRIDDTVIITLKNISAQEITVDTAELTERFVRGDASRNTEGSGLGLAIAKGFMELQGGELSLEVDGDLFKATTTWHV